MKTKCLVICEYFTNVKKWNEAGERVVVLKRPPVAGDYVEIKSKSPDNKNKEVHLFEVIEITLFEKRHPDYITCGVSCKVRLEYICKP
jgi:hypothetical protein